MKKLALALAVFAAPTLAFAGQNDQSDQDRDCGNLTDHPVVQCVEMLKDQIRDFADEARMDVTTTCGIGNRVQLRVLALKADLLANKLQNRIVSASQCGMTVCKLSQRMRRLNWRFVDMQNYHNMICSHQDLRVAGADIWDQWRECQALMCQGDDSSAAE